MSDVPVESSALGGPVTGPRIPPRVKRSITSLSRGIASLWLAAALALFWEFWARQAGVSHLPPPSAIARHFASDWVDTSRLIPWPSDHFFSETLPSLDRFFRGWGLSVIIGITVGILVGRVRVIRDMTTPLIRFWMSVPKTVLLPVAITLFGVRSSMNVFLVTIGTVWVILVNTADGIRGINDNYLEAARSLRLSRRDITLHVVLPAALPRILAGLRVSLGIALILMVVSELYATTAGLGYQIQAAQRDFDYERMWSAIALVALIGIAFNAVFSTLERRLLGWQRTRN